MSNALVVVDEKILATAKRLMEAVAASKGVSIGQLEDQMSGMRPLPTKEEPIRIIPDFPLHTYNFLKRL